MSRPTRSECFSYNLWHVTMHVTMYVTTQFVSICTATSKTKLFMFSSNHRKMSNKLAIRYSVLTEQLLQNRTSYDPLQNYAGHSTFIKFYANLNLSYFNFLLTNPLHINKWHKQGFISVTTGSTKTELWLARRGLT